MPDCCHSNAIQRPPEQGPLYFKRARWNIAFTLAFIILNVFQLIPSPLTLPGLAFGLGLAAITLVMMKYSGGEYYKSAYEALKKKKTNMHSLVALSTGIAWFYSVALCMLPYFFPMLSLHYHFIEIGMILGVVNLGRWQRAKAEDEIQKQTQNHFNLLSKYQPKFARRYASNYSNEYTDIEAQLIEEGDILEVHSGERFPTEGVVVSISDGLFSLVDQKNITGESALLKKQVGDSVLTGTLNKGATLKIRATIRGADNNLRKLLKSLSTQQKAADSEIINKITRYFIPAILSIAALTALSWLLFTPFSLALVPAIIQSVMSVLLCACPCALGLAVPMSTSVSIGKLSEKGILVKNANSFEKAKTIQFIAFDKTGTLTEPVVESVYFVNSMNAKETLNSVASLEKCHPKSHPIAKAILNRATACYDVNHFIAEDQGIKGVVHNRAFGVGSLEFCLKEGIYLEESILKEAKLLNQKGQTTVFVAQEGVAIGLIGLRHQLSFDAKNQIDSLKAKGFKIGLLTGDKAGPAHAIAQQLGLDPKYVWSECSAEAKKQQIRILKKEYHGVAMVGDGMNDVLACEKADISFAIHAWTNAAVKCDVALQGSIEGIYQFLDVSKVVVDNIKQNLGWTFFYNLFALMGATGLLYPILSCALNPILATILMASSSIIVILNAKRLPKIIDRLLDNTSKKEQPSLVFNAIQEIQGEQAKQGVVQKVNACCRSSQPIQTVKACP